MVFNIAFPGPFQWTCGGEQLRIVLDFNYFGILFNAVHGMAVTFPMLKKKMFGAWALLKRCPQRDIPIRLHTSKHQRRPCHPSLQEGRPT